MVLSGPGKLAETPQQTKDLEEEAVHLPELRVLAAAAAVAQLFLDTLMQELLY
jgi:hypothetical protein